MRKKITATILCAALLIPILSACDSTVEPKEPPIALAIVVGRRACSNDFTENMYAEIKEWVERAVYGGYVSIIVGDGEPFVLRAYGADEFPKNANNPQYMMNTLIPNRTKDILDYLKDTTTVRAVSDEIDLLGAIVQAERSLYADEASGLEKRIIVMDSGLPTAGFLNLQNMQITENSAENGDVEKIVSELSSVRGMLPDLKDIAVKWVGLGNVAAPQRLPNTIGVQLEELWRAVLRQSGAVFNDNDIRIKATGGSPNVYSEDDSGFPFVSPIYFDSFHPEFAAEIPPIVEPESEDEPLEEPPSLTITSEQVSFKPDQAVYTNETSALTVLETYAEWLKRYFDMYPEDSKVYVVGFIAKTRLDDSNRLNTRLSEQRAETVKETLVGLGISADKLVVIGLGENGGSYFRVDEFSNGVFDTAIAQQNRKVMLIPDLSDDAAKVLEIQQELENLRN